MNLFSHKQPEGVHRCRSGGVRPAGLILDPCSLQVHNHVLLKAKAFLLFAEALLGGDVVIGHISFVQGLFLEL